jgi:type VI secretion system protein ImpH
MATEDGREGLSLSQELLQTPYRFDFFQAVRLLDHRQRELARARPETGTQLQPVGHDDPHHEAVQFRVEPSLSFPAGAVSQLREAAARPDGDEQPRSPEMVVTFFGLTGPSGVLPRFYTELLIERIRERDYSLRDFLDLFHHRLISLFYRAWEKYRLPISYERSQLDVSQGELEPITRGLYCLVGMGTPGLRGHLEVSDEAFLHYSGHFAHYPRSAIALECLLQDYLDMPVRVLQIQGQWLNLDCDDQSRMPSAREPKGRNNQLGVDLVVGARVWDIQSKFRLRLGPLDWRQFCSLMPNGANLRPVCQLARCYVGPELDFDVQPVLKPDEVRSCEMSGREGNRFYLGWNTWLQSQPLNRQVEDALFALDDVHGPVERTCRPEREPSSSTPIL